MVPSGTNLKHLKESIQLTKFSLSVQFSLRGHEWILLKNVYINMASVKNVFLSQSSFQSVPWKLRILNVISRKHSNYLTRESLCYRNYTSAQTNSVSDVSARPHPLIG